MGTEEKDINAILISAIAITLSVAWLIFNHLKQLSLPRGYISACVFPGAIHRSAGGHVPKGFPDHDPPSACPVDTEPALSRIRAPVVVATGHPDEHVLVDDSRIQHFHREPRDVRRQRTRDVKLRLIRQLRLRNASKTDAMEVSIDECVQSVFMAMGMDTMYRLFQVTLIVSLLGHIDAIVKPIRVTFPASVVICGMLYIFRAIGLNQTSGS